MIKIRKKLTIITDHNQQALKNEIGLLEKRFDLHVGLYQTIGFCYGLYLW